MKRFALGFLFSVLAACGGDDSDSPADKCRALATDTCSRAFDCIDNPGGTQADCNAQLKDALACDDVKSVTSSYDSCMDEINSRTCSVLFPDNPDSGEPELVLPDDCRGVLQQ